MPASDSHNSLFPEICDQYAARTKTVLGPYAAYAWREDPRHLFFSLSRYKFAARMLAGAETLLEAGCGDAFATPILLQEVGRVFGIDVVPEAIAHANLHAARGGKASYACHDLIKAPLERRFDAALSLDVIEHIPPELEDRFVGNLAASLIPHAACVVGTPNHAASPYASSASAREHVNLKDQATLKELLAKHFHNVFIFSMNDEMVHTGFYPMAHYLLALAVDPKWS
ncbi:MAG: class I SAM-dependent methyltransferase [Planctomycetota bacterium]|jgi:2-polyprenyl-3-methyl-5-hydroxy-6-metoxy-1,4-benzoquinol methylase|nr:class I SAM-dependent methyltransferase [Planctomycetota bacterium]